MCSQPCSFRSTPPVESLDRTELEALSNWWNQAFAQISQAIQLIGEQHARVELQFVRNPEFGMAVNWSWTGYWF
jgi:hypothetical protein